MNNGNGYRVAFWVMTVIATVGLVMVSNAIIGNDRLRASEDKCIIDKTEIRTREVEVKIDKVKEYYLSIDRRLSRIEYALKIETHKDE